MSSSEPRLTYGDGLTDLPTAAALSLQGGQVAEGDAAPIPPAPLPALIPPMARSPQPEATGRHQATAAEQDQDSLPPLVSLSDLLLEAPAWLFSAALHMIAVILLGLLFIVPERPLELILQLDEGEGFEELAGSEFDVALDESEQSLDAELEPQEAVTFEDPVLIEPTEINPLVLDSQTLVVAAPIQMALSGRSAGMQQRLLDAYGGTGATQHAVLNALRWLQRNQTSQGLWSLQGNYQDGASVENREAATGLALIAFQGAGYTPQGDPQHDFTKLTSKAWRALLRKQKEDGSFFHTGRSNSQLYTHAICTIALCELYGMTRDSRYQAPAQRAVDYCLKVQSAEGGWRYFPGSGSDLSVTGWFVMALQSARMAGIVVPSPVLKRISGYLDSVASSGGAGYGYQSNSAATASMTAEGLLCRQYLGWSQGDNRLERGANALLQNLPAWERGERDVYYWYYATQVCHHMEGRHWRTWNDTMKVVIPQHQVKQGRERGSWDPAGDEWGTEGGRLYVTCLSTYMLEVYYRHLPIYKADLLGSGL